jgi:dTDP-4-amino-4,6-dideoxygalactose transaminase
MRAQRPGRAVIVVPAYCCPSVPRTVRALGLELRAAPVARDLNLDIDRVGPSLKNDVLAVIGVHMYALPFDVARLQSLAAAVGAYVVDDAAHCAGDPDGSPLGLGGDVGLVSFNQSKTLTGGSPFGGGALFISREDLRPGIARRYAALPEGKRRLSSYLWFALRYAIEVTPRALTEYLRDLHGPVARALGADLDLSERMSAPAALAMRAQINRLDRILAARTALTGYYLNAIRQAGGIEFVQTPTPRYLSRMIVRWDDGAKACDLRETLMRRGLATRTLYPVWTEDNDPTAEFVRHVNATHLELPGSPGLTKEKVEEVVSAVSLCLKAG